MKNRGKNRGKKGFRFLLMMNGGQGALPLGCLPLWGREGVTLISPKSMNEMIDKTGFL